MNQRVKWNIHKFNNFLGKPQAVIITLFILFLYFAYGNAQFQRTNRVLLEQTKSASQNTQTIVSKQDQTLAAIKQLTLDNKLSSKQLGDTIICMLKIPVADRTDDTATQCRQEVQAEDTAANSGSISGTQTGQSSSAATPITSAETPPTTTTPVSVDKVLPNCAVDILFLHIGCN